MLMPTMSRTSECLPEKYRVGLYIVCRTVKKSYLVKLCLAKTAQYAINGKLSVTFCFSVDKKLHTALVMCAFFDKTCLIYLKSICLLEQSIRKTN